MKKWIVLGLTIVSLISSLQAQRITANQAPAAGSTHWYTPVRPDNILLGGSGQQRDYMFTQAIPDGLASYYWLQANGSAFGEEFSQAGLYTNQAAAYRSAYLPGTGSTYLPASIMGFAYVQQRNDGLFVNGYGVPALRIPLGANDTLYYDRQISRFDRPVLYMPFEIGFDGKRPEVVSRHEVKGIRVHNRGRDSVLVVRTVKKSFHVDGEGDFISSDRAAENVLRMRVEIEETDSVYFWDARRTRMQARVEGVELLRMTPTEYFYYASNERGPVFHAVVAEGKIARAAFRTTDATPLLVFGDFGVNVQENKGIVKIPVLLTQPAAEEVRVRWSNMRVLGRASALSDYYPVDDAILTFAPGQMHATIEVAVLEDTVVEDFEEFAVNLYNLEGPAKIGKVAIYSVEIVDNDKPYIYLDTTDVIINESIGVAYIPLRVSVPWHEPIAVQLETIDGTAIANEDFRPYNSLTAQLDAFKMSVPIPISIINDNNLEDSTYFKLRIKAVSSNARFLASGTRGVSEIGRTGLTDTTRIVIVDDDFRPSISFVRRDTMVYEATNLPGNNVHITVQVSLPSTHPITVHYEVFDSSAVNGVDFEAPLPRMFVIPPGTRYYTLKLPIINNTMPQDTHMFRIRIQSVSDIAQVGFTRNHFVTIIDNDLTDEPSSRSNLASAYQLALAPNPATSNVRLSFLPELKPSSARLISLDGRELQSWSITPEQTRSGSIQLPLESVPTGSYLLQVDSPQGRSALRLIIKN